MGDLHGQTLLHTDVRWLTRGKAKTHLFGLHNQVLVYLSDTNFEFKNSVAALKTGVFVRCFSKLNDLNQSL